MRPDDIERQSFAIIDAEAGAHDFPLEQWAIVRRMIHASADFEYLRSMRIHPKAVRAGIDCIRGGGAIHTDTSMARSGIKKDLLWRFGGSVLCAIADEEIAREASAKGITRAAAAVDAAADRMGHAIYVVGNAPTALMRIIELVRQGRPAPALVIGLPVGFVNAAESKAELLTLDIPFITNIGRKGGSNVAAAAVNALILLALRDE